MFTWSFSVLNRRSGEWNDITGEIIAALESKGKDAVARQIHDERITVWMNGTVADQAQMRDVASVKEKEYKLDATTRTEKVGANGTFSIRWGGNPRLQGDKF